MSNLPVRDADVRVRRALVAYKVEAGMERSAAEAWAQSHTAAGVTIWADAFNANGDRDEGAMAAAHQALKAWSRTAP